MSLRKPQYWRKNGCICRKCFAARKNVAEIEEKIYILAQLGKVGVISAYELTGEREKVIGAAGGKA